MNSAVCYGVGSGGVGVRLKEPTASERGHKVVCGMCSPDERRGLICV